MARKLQAEADRTYRTEDFLRFDSPSEKGKQMRGTRITAAALFFVCLGCTFHGAQTLKSAYSEAALTPLQRTSGGTNDVTEKIQKLSSSNPRERAEAACALGEARAVAAIAGLIQTLNDDAQVDQPVCGQKGRWLGNEISKTTPGEMAAVALSRIGSEAVEPLIGALRNNQWQGRANAAFALGLIRDERSIDPLVAATRDSEWHVRSKAVWSLGLAGDRRAVEPLAIALRDPESEVRAQAAWGLGLKGDERAVAPLILALSDADAHVQSQAAWALGLKGDDRAVEPLTFALRAPSEHVRSQAAWALGLKGDQRSVEPLIASLRDTNAHVRAQAAWALGLRGDERAVDPLKVASEDTDEHVRKQAAWALQMRGVRGGLRLDVKPEIRVKVRPK